MSAKYIFTYGSLLSAFDNPAQDLLKEHARFLDKATFRGKLFMIDWYPGVVESENPNDIVHGEVYEIENKEPLLKELDRYEGCSIDDSEPHEFIRMEKSVKLQNSRFLTAWIYIYQRPVSNKERISSGDFASFRF
jgi:gamma-glutamylcyclotransferase (GGCT)/AIG2-like uncharacterized protein YtfP